MVAYCAFSRVSYYHYTSAKLSGGKNIYYNDKVSATCVSKSAVTRKAELEWKASLREPMSRRSVQDNYPANKIPIGILALAALDLSYNAFTDLLPRDLCVALRMGAPLYALNLRFNQVTRVGAKLLLDVMQEFNILRLVDLRGNEDEKLLGVLENGEHYTQFSTFQAPFWLEPTTSETNYSNSETHDKKKKRDSETVRSKHPDQQTLRPFQIGRCNLALPSTTSARGDSVSPTASHFKGQTQSPSPEDSPTNFYTSEGATRPISLESTEESDEVGTNILRMQRPPKKGRPQTAPERRIMPALFRSEQKGSCDQENFRPNTASLNVPSWNGDWLCKHLTTPGMIDPPRKAVSAEPPKMFTNELYEVEEQESTPSNSVCLTNMSSMKKEKELRQLISFSSFRSTPRRSSSERANNKRKIPDSQRRRSRRPSRTSRKSPPPNQIARAKYLTWDVRNQKKTKPSLQNASEEQSTALISSEDIKKEVEWHKFVTDMTETLLTLRDGLDRLIGPTGEDNVLSVTEQGATKLTQTLIGPGVFQKLERSCQVLDSQVTTLNPTPKKSENWKIDNAHQMDIVRQTCLAAEQARKRVTNTRMRF